MNSQDLEKLKKEIQKNIKLLPMLNNSDSSKILDVEDDMNEKV